MSHTIKTRESTNEAIPNFDLAFPLAEEKKPTETNFESERGAYLSQPTLFDAQEAKEGQKVIVINLPGQPVPWARPVPVRRNGKQGAVTQKRQASYKRSMQYFIRQACANYQKLPGNVPVKVSVIFSYEIQRKKTEFKTTRPDIDNLLKLVLDALQGGYMLIEDDGQIAEIYAKKVYGQQSFTEIKIEW